MNKNNITDKWIKEEYEVKKRSFKNIAEQLETYTAWVRRRAIKAGVKIRSRSEAQAIALKQGRAQHPTEGKKRSEEVKKNISNAVSTSWKNLSKEEYDKRVEVSREQRRNMSDSDIRKLHKAAGEGIRRAAKDGSKMEQFLNRGLTSAGYYVEYHKVKMLANRNLEVDLFLPRHSIAIEIDGPSHFEPIWGDAALIKTKRADNQKNGLLMKNGVCIIRIKHLSKNLSNKIMRDTLEKVLEKIDEIVVEFPKENKLLIELEA